jgi:hypothetical protein
MDDIIKLNVGGQLFVTTRATLCAEAAGSMLATKFDPESKFALPKEIDGAVFLDREPITFHYILKYLRNGCQVVSDIPDELLKDMCADANYFGLIGLKQACTTSADTKQKQSNSASVENIMEYRPFYTNQGVYTALKQLVLEMNAGWRVDVKVSEYDGGNIENWTVYIISRPRPQQHN